MPSDRPRANIITPEERARFLRLRADWLASDCGSSSSPGCGAIPRRTPTRTANSHLASRSPSRTDRGRIYILFGPPDEIERKASVQLWRYRFIERIGDNVTFGFTDRDGRGEYVLTSGPAPPPFRRAVRE
jgi:hypothetical protein